MTSIWTEYYGARAQHAGNRQQTSTIRASRAKLRGYRLGQDPPFQYRVDGARDDGRWVDLPLRVCVSGSISLDEYREGIFGSNKGRESFVVKLRTVSAAPSESSTGGVAPRGTTLKWGMWTWLSPKRPSHRHRQTRFQQ
jgi:hypothetical protein